jgi:glucose-6-phosphate isomerase
MLTSSINFKSFNLKLKTSEIKQKLAVIIKEKNQVIESLSKNYKNSFDKKKLKVYQKSSNYRVIGMGGSTLGTQAIYSFLKDKIKKNFVFFDNLKTIKKKIKKNLLQT